MQRNYQVQKLDHVSFSNQENLDFEHKFEMRTVLKEVFGFFLSVVSTFFSEKETSNVFLFFSLRFGTPL